ncbi:hypothetical protein C9374_002725 [Naegleria lovaniensis]|uniref:Importin N-terminal domain-containing protein n=1 Tax=Naegleria lovaniensis TaxID=51637 RepID=A0AA88GUA3_NAELO|nr:uncharacterized protein C9374_002725 [Naegleria lovaniensis]KAG2386279.1 hypothetical protein C9374_002725 [Naegleria lovaniensis]
MTQRLSRNDLPSLSPSDEHELSEVLRRSMSSVKEEQKTAEKTLLEIEKRNGYLSLLMQIIVNTNVDMDVRYLASICFKNTVDKYWRTNMDFSISQEEKEYLKQGLLNILLTNTDAVLFNSQFVTQLALATSKISRIDYPSQWTNLISSIGNCIVASTNENIRNRCLVVLKHFVKEQATRTYMDDGKKAFRQFSSDITPFICQLWFYYANKIYQSGSNIDDLEYKNCLICTRIIWRVAVMGLSAVDKNTTLMDFLTSVLDFISKFYAVRQNMILSQNTNSELFHKITTLISSFIKVPLRIQAKHSIGFRKHLLSYSMLFSQIMFECDPKAPTTDYKILPSIAKLYFVFDYKYLTNSPNDLEKWDEDPEEFVKEQELDWSDTTKAASEYFYLAIMGTFENRIAKFVIQFTEKVLHETYGSLEQDKLLLRDSCYSAIGWASYNLYNEIQFSQWYIHMLRKELLPTEAFAQDKRYNIIRRKCMWLLGRWVEKFDNLVRKDILSTLVTILIRSDDLVMKLTSLITLKIVLSEDTELRAEDFAEFLQPFMSSLVQLLDKVEQEDTKLSLLSLICTVVEKMENNILPYCETLVKILPIFWNAVGDSTLVKTQVIAAISKIVKLLEHNSVILYDFLLPLIQYSTDIDQEEHLYFIEEGLDLWHITMQYAPEPTQGLMSLFPNIVKIFDHTVEYVMPNLRLIESYVLLGKSQFLSTYGPQLNSIFLNVLCNTKPKAIYLCSTVIETIFTEFPVEASINFASPVKKMMEIFLNHEEKSSVLTGFLCVFSRLVFFNKNVLYEIMDAMLKEGTLKEIVANGNNNTIMAVGSDDNSVATTTTTTTQPPPQTQHEILLRLIDAWTDMSDSIVSPFHRKYSTLALLSFYPSTDPEILNRFSTILAISIKCYMILMNKRIG